MTSPVLAALANARAQEQAEQERTLTAAVRKRLNMALPSGDAGHWPVWQQWCAKNNVAPFPALPAAVAVFVLNHAALGDKLETVIASIGAVHEADGRANPVLSPIVLEALDQVLPPIEPPSGWPKDRKADFGRLHRDLQKFIVAHERRIIKEMRNAQNEAARAKRKDDNHHGNLEQASAAAARADRIDTGSDRNQTAA